MKHLLTQIIALIAALVMGLTDDLLNVLHGLFAPVAEAFAYTMANEAGQFTLGAFGEDIDPAAANVNITAVPDAHLTTNGDDITVPSLANIAFAAGGIALNALLCRLESPTLRNQNRLAINPLNGLNDGDVEPSDPPAVYDIAQNPRRLSATELLQCVINSNPAAAAFQWCGVGFSDGPITPVVRQEVVTVEATSATTVTARAWSATQLTFTDRLDPGKYEVLGLRAIGATMILARFVFKPGRWRPGALAMDSMATVDHPLFRNGKLGVWGEFSSTEPPDIEVLCDSGDTTQRYFIDLVKISDTP